jgi:NADPH2:quinone reductase
MNPDHPTRRQATWSVGDVVCALVSGGGYATRCVAPGVQCLPAPRGLSLVEAAAVPETFFTVWTNVFDRGRLSAGEWLLVHGGTSGIGTTAIQLAVARGSHVLATAGTDEKCRAVEALGAKRCINYKNADFVAAVKEITGGRGVDVISGHHRRRLHREEPRVSRERRSPRPGWTDGRRRRARSRCGLILLKRLTVTGSTLASGLRPKRAR